MLCMHVNTVTKALQRFRAGQPLVNAARSARRPLLSIDDLAALRDLVIEGDTLYLDELRAKLALARGKAVSNRTLLRGLCQLGLNRKRVRACAARAPGALRRRASASAAPDAPRKSCTPSPRSAERACA